MHSGYIGRRFCFNHSAIQAMRLSPGVLAPKYARAQVFCADKGRGGRQNSRGQAHALPKARNAGKLLFGNSRELWRIQLAVFLGCRDFLSAKSVMSSLLLQAFCQNFVFFGHLLCCLRMEKYCRYVLPSMLCIRPSIQAKQSASSRVPRRFSGLGPAGCTGAGLAVRGKLCSEFVSICKLQNIAPDASPSAPL